MEGVVVMIPFATSLLMELILEYLNQLHFGVVGFPINLKRQDCDMRLEFVSKLVGFAGSSDHLRVENGLI